jgi:hypothetical protein
MSKARLAILVCALAFASWSCSGGGNTAGSDVKDAIHDTGNDSSVDVSEIDPDAPDVTGTDGTDTRPDTPDTAPPDETGADSPQPDDHVEAVDTAEDGVEIDVPDTLAPIVVFLSPLDGDTVQGSVPVEVSATDNVGVTKVEIAVDGGSPVVLTSEPWQYAWDTTLLGEGPRTLSATAYDAAGNHASKEITVTVQGPDAVNPVVYFLSPLDGDAVQGETPIEVFASDDRGVVAKVEIVVNGELKATLTSEPWEWSWDATGLDGGPYTLAVTAYDPSDNHASQEITVLVLGTCGAGGVCPPSSVKIIYPVDGASVCGGITIEAAAAEGDNAIAKVVFYVDGVPQGADQDPPYQRAWDTTGISNGQHELKAEAQDTIGQKAFTLATVTVSNQPGVPCDNWPSVKITNPVPKGTSAYVTGTVTVEAEASDDDAVTKVRFIVDNGMLMEDPSIPYSTPWNTGDFTEGVHTLKATAYDTADQKSTDAIQVVIDRTDPTVQFVEPSGGLYQDGWPLSATAADNFGIESVVFEIGNGLTTVQLTDPPWESSFDATGLSSGSYTVHVTATDRAGLRATDYRYVSLDRVPHVEFTSPEPGAVVVGPNTAAVTATDDMGPVQGVDFYVDDELVGSFTGESSGDPWEGTFDISGHGTYDWTPPFVYGDHKLRAVAHDSRNQTATVELFVKVDWPIEMEVAACPATGPCIPLPADQTFDDAHGVYALSVVATDDNGPIQTIALKVDGTLVSSALSDPFDLALDTTVLGDGTHVLLLEASGTGDSTGSVTIPISVNNCDRDGDGYLAKAVSCGGTDCDDANKLAHPNALDTVGDGIDQNCDLVDGVDADGDAHASVASGGGDCDDTIAATHPGAVDTVGDGIDQNCDHIDGVDADGDGYASKTSGGDDCNDVDELVHPNALDTVGDVVDQNCDGIDGVDADGDGHASEASGGDDCDDTKAGIHPGAVDTVGDVIDQNCDLVDGVDADGDGHASEASGGDDCDDTKAGIHPGAVDTVGDVIDQNCDHIDGVDADGDGYASKTSGGDDCNDVIATIHVGVIDTVGNSIDENCDGVDGEDLDHDGYASLSSGGDDCDDRKVSVHPSANDIVGDNFDENCDGVDGVDADGDGYASLASGGNDCDDSQVSTNPAAQDLFGDGIDQNCDGVDGYDPDHDGILDNDNCPSVANVNQLDIDGDGVGDACDSDNTDGPLADRDGDGIPNGIDNCPFTVNPDQGDIDTDGDGVIDCNDNCKSVVNSSQSDIDGDGRGDVCDLDADGDGDPNATDCAPYDASVRHGATESCNGKDDDCDGSTDEGFVDTDGDGMDDCKDSDDDNDGVKDWLDNCPSAFNMLQQDADGDGVGDACDPDYHTCNQTLADVSVNITSPVNFQTASIPDATDPDGDGKYQASVPFTFTNTGVEARGLQVMIDDSIYSILVPTPSSPYTVKVPNGQHRIAFLVTDMYGIPYNGCENARDAVILRIARPCAVAADCDDGNPCSTFTCNASKKCEYSANTAMPRCCNSDYDCDYYSICADKLPKGAPDGIKECIGCDADDSNDPAGACQQMECEVAVCDPEHYSCSYDYGGCCLRDSSCPNYPCEACHFELVAEVGSCAPSSSAPAECCVRSSGATGAPTYGCDDGLVVNQHACIGNACYACSPNCVAKQCGSDGCGGTCGSCSCGEECVAGVCGFTACDGRSCGDDGCGRKCGSCANGGICTNNLCLYANPTQNGDIVVTEIMARSQSGSGDAGEWIELYNATNVALDLAGCTLHDSWTDAHTISSPLLLLPGAYSVLALSGDAVKNHGANPDYVYSNFTLSNSGDEIVLTCGVVDIDSVVYSYTWVNLAISIQLDPGAFAAGANDLFENWCPSKTQFGPDGLMGTPGAANVSCKTP